MPRPARYRRLPRGIRELGISIEETADCAGKLGGYRHSTREITIQPNQPWVGKNITLLHELLHAVDFAMVESGVRKRLTSHDWIENASMNLLLALVLAGLWRGVTKEEMQEFYTNHHSRKGKK